MSELKRDTALQYVDRARQCIQQNDFDRARRHIAKAFKCCPNLEEAHAVNNLWKRKKQQWDLSAEDRARRQRQQQQRKRGRPGFWFQSVRHGWRTSIGVHFIIRNWNILTSYCWLFLFWKNFFWQKIHFFLRFFFVWERQPSRRQEEEPPPSKRDEALKNAKDPEVIRIINEKDYYKILGAEKNEEEKQLRKKYRKVNWLNQTKKKKWHNKQKQKSEKSRVF